MGICSENLWTLQMALETYFFLLSRIKFLKIISVESAHIVFRGEGTRFWIPNHMQELSNEPQGVGRRWKGGDCVLFFVKEYLAAVSETKGGGHHQDNLNMGSCLCVVWTMLSKGNIGNDEGCTVALNSRGGDPCKRRFMCEAYSNGFKYWVHPSIWIDALATPH